MCDNGNMEQSSVNTPVYAVYFRPSYFGSRSGLGPLAEAVGAHKITHGCFWRSAERIHWRLGDWYRRQGQTYYGSSWNYLMPVVDELRIARRMNNGEGIAHFLFAEFAGPRRARPFKKKGHRIVGTFHASPRRQTTVTDGVHLDVYDSISVVSRCQQPYFIDRGYPASKLHVTLHGVDTTYFRPDSMREGISEDRPLQGLFVGSTERDHEFAARLMNVLPDGIMHLSVATTPNPHPAYREVRQVTLLPFLDDHAMLRAYQQADILVMPLLDATANNAILEAMACGTPVLTNCTGGTPDYIDTSCNYVVEQRDLDEWVAMLVHIAGNRDALAANRKSVRVWAESLSWESVAHQYRAMYRSALEN
mgnify:CR=1 FL=1